MTDDAGRDSELDALRKEVTRLRAENEQLRVGRRTVAPKSVGRSEATRRIRVLLLPDPVRETAPGRPGSEVATSLARVHISHLSACQPEVAWRAEYDLAQIPDDAECFQLGEVLRRTWDGTGPLPAQYRVETGETGERRLKRCLIAGDADSDRFCAAYDRHLRDAHELLNEGQVAHAAGAYHHAVWTLKAVDVVLAQATLARARFDAGRDDWKAVLDTPRPEYDPRYRVSGEHPVGW